MFDWLCQLILGIWNSLIGILNFVLGVCLNPIGFLWWIVSGALALFANILPSSPSELRLSYVINQIGISTGLGSDLISEILGTVSQMLVIVAVIKIYKLIPFKAT